MRLLINHLTRMRPEYICVAGISADTNRHVRPILAGGLNTTLLRRSGGPFGLGCVVHLGETLYCGHAPEVEDYQFNREYATYLRTLDPSRYWSVLESVSRSKLADIFGNDLRQRSRSCVVNVGAGTASLGCLRPPRPPRVYVNSFGKIRMTVTDNVYEADLSVTDLRLYEVDHRTPRRELVTRIDRRISAGEEVILSVGLTRPFRPEGDEESRHWLQVNNIHLSSSPIWDEDTVL